MTRDQQLLPSQEALLQRLQHISLYGQQLIVVTGERGAGKTTIATSLLNELELYSCALVICPKHCHSSEIRRKILSQILTEPVFDDDIPLAETAIRHTADLPDNSFIVLDDAQYMPIELFAESLLLSQIQLPGKSISLILTMSHHEYELLLNQLPEQQKEQLLAIAIPPLTMEERKSLYYRLLTATGETPFTPKTIVTEQLLRQQGTPQEVISLLELALEDPVADGKKFAWKRLVTVCGIFIVVLSLIYFGLARIIKPDIVQVSSSPVTHQQGVVKDNEQTEFSSYGEKILANYCERFLLGHTNSSMNNDEFDTSCLKAQTEISEVQEDRSLQIHEIKPFIGLADISGHELQKSLPEKTEPVTEIEHQTQVVEETVEKIEQISQPKSIYKPASEAIEEQKIPSLQIPASGFTLQLASVNHTDSLYRLLDTFVEEQEIKVARHQQRWIILLGHYEDKQDAVSMAKKLGTKYQINAPWVRSWQQLSQYQLQLTLPTREIAR